MSLEANVCINLKKRFPFTELSKLVSASTSSQRDAGVSPGSENAGAVSSSASTASSPEHQPIALSPQVPSPATSSGVPPNVTYTSQGMSYGSTSTAFASSKFMRGSSIYPTSVSQSMHSPFFNLRHQLQQSSAGPNSPLMSDYSDNHNLNNDSSNVKVETSSSSMLGYGCVGQNRSPSMDDHEAAGGMNGKGNPSLIDTRTGDRQTVESLSG